MKNKKKKKKKKKETQKPEPSEKRKKKKGRTMETEPRRRKKEKKKEIVSGVELTIQYNRSHYVCLITKMSLSYELWKLKTAKMCFQFP